MFRKIALQTIFASLVLSSSSIATAAPPQAVHYQGFLTDADGSPLNEAVDMEFRLYDVEVAGEAFWETDGPLGVDVESGVFRVNLAPVTAEHFAGGEVWLGITIIPSDDEEPSAEMDPRLKVLSVPYALVADHAASADVAGEASSVTNVDFNIFATGNDVQDVLGVCIQEADLTAALDGYCASPCYGDADVELFVTENGYVTLQVLAQWVEENISVGPDEEALAAYLSGQGYLTEEEVIWFLSEAGFLKAEDLAGLGYAVGPHYTDGDVEVLLATKNFCQGPCFSGSYGDLADKPSLDGHDADTVDGFDTNATGQAVAQTIPITDMDGKIPQELLPFNKGDLLAPADRQLVQGLADYENEYFNIEELGIEGGVGANVKEGVKFGPGGMIEGSMSACWGNFEGSLVVASGVQHLDAGYAHCYSNVYVAAGATLTATMPTNQSPLIIEAAQNIVVHGTIDLHGKGATGNAGGAGGAGVNGKGEPNGPPAQPGSGCYEGGGSGGAGGGGAVGGVPQFPRQSMSGGAGGGGGTGSSNSSWGGGKGGDGGSGGLSLVLMAKGLVEVTGNIDASGSGGGTGGSCASLSNHAWTGGGGGGGGGAGAEIFVLAGGTAALGDNVNVSGGIGGVGGGCGSNKCYQGSAGAGGSNGYVIVFDRLEAFESCNDGNPCTQDVLSEEGECSHEPSANVCTDFNACTQGDACSAGICEGTPKSCDDGEPYTTDECDPGIGCVNDTCPLLAYEFADGPEEWNLGGTWIWDSGWLQGFGASGPLSASFLPKTTAKLLIRYKCLGEGGLKFTPGPDMPCDYDGVWAPERFVDLGGQTTGVQIEHYGPGTILIDRVEALQPCE
jgi:hypothetical protein